jgi:pyridoxal phosphate enzyme (YggS family)
LGDASRGWVGLSAPELGAAIAAVLARIDAAARAAGRDPAQITLVAVSKTVPAERVRDAVAAGQLDLGENYAQELRDKARVVPGARWHYIGPLQRNKVKYVVGTAQLIHTVGDAAIAAEIAARAARMGLTQRCLVQVNVGKEVQKSGCAIEALPSLLAALAAHASLRVEGLMCIPPADEDPRPHFATLRGLAEQHRLAQLSMGMSADYELAIAEGATLVRVGSAIFGARPA